MTLFTAVTTDTTLLKERYVRSIVSIPSHVFIHKAITDFRLRPRQLYGLQLAGIYTVLDLLYYILTPTMALMGSPAGLSYRSWRQLVIAVMEYVGMDASRYLPA